MTEASLKITADNSEFLKALAQSQAALASSFESMKGTLEGLGSAFEKVQKAVLGVTSILAGGGVFKEVLESTVKWAEGSIDLSRALGITTEKASVYQAALTHLGISNDVLVTASDKVSKQIYTNSAAFEKLGVSVKDTSTGAFRPSVDIIADVNSKLAAIPNVIERNIAAQQVYGRSFAELRPLMRLTAEESANAEARAKSLGLIVGPAGAAQAHAYKEGLADVGLVVTGLSQQLGNELIPVLINAGRIFAETGPKDLDVFATILKGISWWAGVVSIEFEKMGLWLGKLAAQASALVHGDFGAIGAIQKDFNNDLAALNKNADELWDKLNRKPPVQVSAEPDRSKQSGFGEKETSRTGEWQTALEEKKAAFQEEAAAEGQLREYSKQQEIAYWQSILQTSKTTLEERKEIRAKIAADELQIDKAKLEGSLETLKNEEAAHGQNLAARLAADMKYAEAIKGIYGQDSKEYAAAQKAILETKRQEITQEEQLDSIRTATAKQATLASIATEEEAAKERYDMGAISLKDLIGLEKKYEGEKYALELEALQRQLALVSPDDPVRKAQMLQQIQALETQHNGAILKLDQQLAQQQGALWRSLAQTIQTQMTQAFEGLIKHTETVQQAFEKMFDALMNVIVNFVAKWITQQLTAAAAQLLNIKTQAVAQAGQVAIAAGASVAAIPVYGWAMAPGVMASTFAEASGYAVAEHGFEVPRGLNPMTQLHSQEMVLPQGLADRVRAVTPDPGGSGRGAGGDMHLHVKANDAHSFYRQLKGGGTSGPLGRALKDLHRRYAR